MRSLTLLIQLFGRDVMDRLAATGFDSGRALARAGADRLAEETGIALPLARRIVAVAIESTPPEEETGPAPRAASPDSASAGTAQGAPARAGSAGVAGGGARRNPRGASEPPPGENAVHVRRPLRWPSSSLAKGRPETASETATEGVVASAPADDAPADPRRDDPAIQVQPTTLPERPEEPATGNQGIERPLDSDPFVDDVSLISWMGLNARSGTGRARFGVADGILDLSRRDTPRSAARSDPPRRAAPERSPLMEEASVLQAPLATTPSMPDPSVVPSGGDRPVAAPGQTPPTPAASRRPPLTLTGSFWCFGRPSRPGGPQTDEDPATAPAHKTPGNGGDRTTRPKLPRRRAHDEQ